MSHQRTIFLALALMAFAPLPLSAEILDRIVAIINNNVILTQSDVRREQAIQAAFGSNLRTDQAILDALIEQHLIQEQVNQFREIDVPEDLVAARLRELGDVPGVSVGDLRAAVIRELQRNEFIVQRFEQFIRASDDELRRYYEDIYAPELRRLKQPVPPVEQGIKEVRRYVILEKLGKEVSVWLEDLRRRSVVEKISK